MPGTGLSNMFSSPLSCGATVMVGGKVLECSKWSVNVIIIVIIVAVIPYPHYIVKFLWHICLGNRVEMREDGEI